VAAEGGEVMQLRPFQERGINEVRKAVRAGHKWVCIVSPTGSGKMVCAASVMAGAQKKGKPALFLCDLVELVGQCRDTLDTLEAEFGIVSAQYDNENPHSLLQVVAKDTLIARAFKRKRMFLPDAAVVCVDEAHRSMAPTFQTVLKHYAEQGAVILGFTATPIRTDGRGMANAGYTAMVQLATYKELQADGYLVPCRYWAPFEPDLSGIKVSKGDYAAKPLEERMNQDVLVGNVVKDYRQHGEGRVAVLFASGVAHSIHCRNMFVAAGLRAEHLDGTTPWNEREDIIGRLRDGKLDVMCNYGVATTGLDVPIAKCGILARPTKSYGLLRQMIGRFMRPYPGYSDCLVIDHTGRIEAFLREGLPFPDEDVEWSLDATERLQDREMRKRKEKPPKPEKEPYKCKNKLPGGGVCNTLYRGPRCPKCGHRPERKGKVVDFQDGELRELERKKANRNATISDKQKVWNDCLGWAIGNKRPVGAAAHRYRDRFGVWPKGLDKMPRSTEWKMRADHFYQLLAERRKDT